MAAFLIARQGHRAKTALAGLGTEAGKTALQGGEWGAQGYLRETETWGLSPRLSGEAAR